MGLQRLNGKKVRRLSQLAGIEFDAACVRSTGRIAECRTPDDVHYLVDRKTGEVEPDPDGFHWKSCNDPEWEATAREHLTGY